MDLKIATLKTVVVEPLTRTSLGGRTLRTILALRDAPSLLHSGLFDQEFYEAETDLKFAGRFLAARHYLRNRHLTGHAPNCLLEPEWFAPDNWRRYPDPGRRLLRSRSGSPSPHPLFDAAVYLSGQPRAADHPGGALGHFLTHALPTDTLPVGPDHLGPVPMWAETRSALLAVARRNASFESLGGGRRIGHWNARSDAAYIAEWGRRPVSVPEGNPLVTIVTPVRNRPEQVAVAIRSVLAQTFSAWELLVVDDGSTDSTADVVAAFAAADPRIHLLCGEARGVCAARNAALAEARGEWVAFLDSDNVLTPEYLHVMLANLTGRGLLAGHAVVDSEVPGPGRYLAFSGGRDHLLVKNHIDLNALVVRRELLNRIGGFDESLRRWVDHDLALRISGVTDIPLVPFVGVRYDADHQSSDRITLREADYWEFVVLGKAWVDWEAAHSGLAARVPGRTSICMPTYDDWQLTVRAVRAVLTNAGGADVEVVVLDNGSRRAVGAILAGMFGADPRVRIEPVPRNLNFAIGSNLAFVRSTGDRVVFLNNDTEVEAGWLAPLLAQLEEKDVLGVQPLLLYPDGTIQSAGSAFPGGDVLPRPLLENHPPEDAEELGTIRLRAVTAAALAMRATDVVALRGFDHAYINGFEDVDLCLRAGRRQAGSFVVATDSRVMHYESRSRGRGARMQANRRLFLERWLGSLPPSDLGVLERLGFKIAHLEPGHPTTDPADIRIPWPVVVRPARTVDVGDGVGLPALRWAIKTAAPAGPKGDGWGDTHFARHLAGGLRRLGQQVVVDRREAHQRSTQYLDDVVLVLRGLDEVSPHPGRVNLLWVISHPELVQSDEVRRFDASFAAGVSWASEMTRRSGVPVQPLYQATDPSTFNPERATPDTGPAVLFVGGSRNVFRQVVRDALAAGVDLAVYGDRWDDYGLGESWKAPYLANDELGAAYRAAGVVLNDHWADMARDGFVSNRLFDAVACGARVISDEVAGLAELFEGAVQTYRTPEDLARLAGPGRELAFPDEERRLAIAARVAREHSFDARARQLMDAALAVRDRQGWVRP